MYDFSRTPKDDALRIIRKRRNIYTIIWAILLVFGGVSGVIPVIGWYVSTAALVICGIFAGLGMFCINCYRFTKTDGRKQGGGLLWLLLFIFGLIIIPLITVVICNHVRGLARKVLGVEVE